MLILLAGYLRHLYHHAFLRHRHSVISLCKIDNENWMLRTVTASYHGKLAGDSTITRWVSILRFQLNNQHQLSFIVLDDSLVAQDGYRHLLKAISLL